MSDDCDREDCDWKAISTFLDECRTCGATFRYPNTNDYEERLILPPNDHPRG